MTYRNKGSPNQVVDDSNKSFHKAEAAGRPSNWDENRRSTYAGRRSRRNSITDDSQLTIENFGGSQVRNNSVHETLLKKIETIRVRLECHLYFYLNKLNTIFLNFFVEKVLYNHTKKQSIFK